MSLSAVLLALWLVLTGLTQLGAILVSGTILGLLALVTGLLLFVEAWHPISLWRREP